MKTLEKIMRVLAVVLFVAFVAVVLKAVDAYDTKIQSMERYIEILEEKLNEEPTDVEIDVRGLNFMDVTVWYGYDYTGEVDYYRFYDADGKEVRVYYDDDSVVLNALMEARWQAGIKWYEDDSLNRWYNRGRVFDQLEIIKEALLRG